MSLVDVKQINFSGSIPLTGSFIGGDFTGSFSGNLYGTSSYANTASIAITASYVIGGVAINNPVLNAYTSSVLYVDTTGSLSNDDHFTYDRVNRVLKVHAAASDESAGFYITSANGQEVARFGASNTRNVYISGSLTIGSSSSISSRLYIPIAPTIATTYGLISIGNGPFDGVTSGFFSGSISGTLLAANVPTGYRGNFFDYQINGVSKISSIIHDASSGVSLSIQGFGSGTSAGDAVLTLGLNGVSTSIVQLRTSQGSGNDFSYLKLSSSYITSRNNRLSFNTDGSQTNSPFFLSIKGVTIMPVAPTATPNYGLFNLGTGAFNGSTAGYFKGSSNGTLLAGNLISGGTSDLISLQLSGLNRFKVTSAGSAVWGDNVAAGEGNYMLFTRLGAYGYSISSWWGTGAESWNLDYDGLRVAAAVMILNTANGTGKLRLRATMLGFDALTSASPALKRSSTELQVRLADDSDFTKVGIGGLGIKPTTFSSTTTASAVNSSFYVFTGSSASQELDLPAGVSGLFYFIKNRGSVSFDIDPNGTEEIYTTAALGAGVALTVNPGEAYTLAWDGTYWVTL